MSCIYNIPAEWTKCIGCNSCTKHCPLKFSMNIVIKLYKEKRLDDMYKYIFDNHPFPLICSKICPDHFCMEHCPTDVNIKDFRAYLSFQRSRPKEKIAKNGKKIAIVGGGVSGLTTAWYLYRKGYTIDLYEIDQLGGELNYIPEERLPNNILNLELGELKNYIDNLYLSEFSLSNVKNYDKVIYCIGSRPKQLDIETNNTLVYYNSYLQNPSKTENIGIIGGGNVALDCAIHNQGRSTIFVRRNLSDMRINKKDYTKIIDKKIAIVDNFIPLEIKYDTLFGTFYDNPVRFKFDRIIIAIGREPLILNNLSDKEVQIIPSKSAIETIAGTLEQLKGLEL